ncbi:nucleotide-diphospho-sugar transferase [Pontibacter qinzhouensis]|uniref:Nucleotide-diphospho-sugar transferase n=1 Tax=Pontibacter qinzhouensis TaxID=2603253 RepID=A0A5C8J932_9BACT|nr:nucleotide-diphospho-sugar transferase [Pontibacter qinzhouensis]TXK33781.1 nucleotide-diphospho-sugar transferase [Pontibacter qinzhouensis]
MSTLTFEEPLHTPVLLIIFNRAHTTQKVFDRIRQVKPKRLYVAADGPRPHVPADQAKCAETRKIIDQVDWDCEVKTLFHDQNLRCGVAPSTAISWLYEHEETGIILEDDCIPSKSFFWFCQELLEKYKHDTRIMHISGNNYLDGWRNDSDYSYYFSDKVNSWGWATWRRAWQLYDFNIANYPELKQKGYLNGIFLNKFEEMYRLSKLDETFTNIEKGDVWDYQWEFTVYSNSGLCIVPEVNLVRNIGFGEDATHTFNLHDKKAQIQEQEIEFPLRHPRFVIRDIESDKRNFNYLIRDKVTAKLKNIFSISL